MIKYIEIEKLESGYILRHSSGKSFAYESLKSALAAIEELFGENKKQEEKEGKWISVKEARKRQCTAYFGSVCSVFGVFPVLCGTCRHLK